MTNMVKARVESGIVLEVFPNDCVNWLHKDLYSMLIDVEDIVKTGDTVDVNTGLKISDAVNQYWSAVAVVSEPEETPAESANSSPT
jgi:hypothetical protein